MSMSESAKKSVETLTGLWRPAKNDLASIAHKRKPRTFGFKGDGKTPNNPRFPMIPYRSPVHLRGDFDPGAIFEDLFAANGWKESWRDGMYDYLHFHTRTHEVLGVARGRLRAEPGDLLANARKLGLDSAKFDAALKDPAIAERVQSDVVGGVRSGVNGTPACFIDELRFDGNWTNMEEFVAALEDAAGRDT